MLVVVAATLFGLYCALCPDGLNETNPDGRNDIKAKVPISLCSLLLVY